MKNLELAAAETVLVLELEKGLRAGQLVWRTTSSIRGREGTLVREWTCPDGVLTDGQYRDFTGWIEQSLTAAVLAVDGAQAVLRL